MIKKRKALVRHTSSSKLAEKPINKFFNKPSHKSTIRKCQSRQRILPQGIKVLIGYSSLLGIFYLLFGLLIPTTIFFGLEITGDLAKIINIFMALLIFVMVLGLYFARSWAYYLSLWLYFLSIISSISIIFFPKNGMFGIISSFIVIASILAIVINMITAWYVMEKKEYFVLKKNVKANEKIKNYDLIKKQKNLIAADVSRELSLVDRVFISSIYLFYFFTVISALALGMQFYSNVTLKIDNIMTEIDGKTFEQSMNFCNSLDLESRDICYMTSATIFSKVVDPRPLCVSIQDDFFRFTCVRSIS